MKRRKKRLHPAVLFSLLLCLCLSPLTLSREEAGAFSLSGAALRVENAVEKAKAEALQELAHIRKVYRLAPGSLAPEPDPAGYRVLHSHEEVLSLLEEAAELLDGREPFFNGETPFEPEEGVHCYRDESILVLLWHQSVTELKVDWPHKATMAEIFLSDAGQFRRALSGDRFGSELLKTPTDMAAEVNAVYASSGDFYRFRSEGLCVYEGELCRFNASRVDSCAVDDKGDLLFLPAGMFRSEQEAKDYIAAHHISFTLSFGPILAENYRKVEPDYFYPLGESYERYSRLLLGQRDALHYLEMDIVDHITPFDAADILLQMGVERCYALDGGQTATMVMEGNAQNLSLFGFGNAAQRTQSDIIYFVSAVPAAERSP